MSKPTRRSVIPNIPTNVDPNMRQFLEAVRESMQVTMGQRGNKLDSAVTFRDLEGKFGVTMQAINALREEVGRPKPEGGVIDAPTGLGVAYAFDTALVYWDFPYMSGYAYTEVFRVGVEAINGNMPSEPAFSEDYLIATVDGSRITDTIAPDFAYFYWVRHVGRNGKNSAIAGPVYAIGSDLPSKIVEDTLGQLPNDPFIQELQQRIADIDLTPLEQADQLLQSELASLVQALANADQRLTAADQALQTQIGNVNTALQSADQRLTAADQALQTQIGNVNSALQSADQRLTAADQALQSQIDDANAVLQSVDEALQEGLDNVNATLQSADQRLTAADQALQTQIGNVNSALQSVDQRLTAADQALQGGLDSVNAALQSADQRLTAADQALQTQIGNVNSALQSADQRLTAADQALQTQIGNVNSALQSADQRLTAADQALQTQIGNVNSALQSADQRLTAADQALDEAISDAKEFLEGQIASQGSSITALQSTTATQATSLNNLTTRVGSAESSITSLNTTTGNHASRLTSIESVNTTQGTNISSLQTTTASHATSISRLGAFDTTANKYAFIKTLEEVDATQANQISGLTTRMEGAESSITTLNNTTATQATSLNSLTTRVGSAESSITSLNTTTGNHASRLTSIESVNTTQGTNISSLQTTTASHATSISRLGAFDTTANKYAFIKNLEEVDATQASQISGLTTRMEGAESSITTLNNTTATQASSLNSLTTRVGSAESSISTLNTTTGNHASRLTSIESVNTTQGTNISSLQTTTASHATSISRLGAFNTTANKYAFIVSLEEVDATQASQISGLTTRMTGAESSITTLNNTTATQATSLSNLTTRVGSAESSISTLNTTTGNHASRLTSIESVNTTQGANISSLQTTTASHATAISRLGAFDATANKYAFIKTLEEVDATQASQISGLTTRMTGAESSITTLNNTTATQATSLNNLTTRVADAESEISNLNETTADQATSLSSLTTRVGSAESSISTLNTTTSGHASRLTSIESVNTTQGTNISSLQTTTASHATAISRLGAFDTTANKYAFIKTLEEVDATQASQISGLNTRMGSAESSITTLNTTTSGHASRLTSIESVNTTQGTNISSLQTTTASHATAISRLGAYDTTANKYAFIKTLEEVDATQASQISGLTTRMEGAESSITTLNNTTATQATSLNNLTTRVGSAESSITSLNTTTSGHASRLTSIESVNTTQGTNISSLQTTTASHATAISRLGAFDATANKYAFIKTLEEVDATQASQLSGLSTRMGSAESSITSLNTTTGNHASRLTSIESVNTTQGTNISSLQTTTASHATAISRLGAFDATANKYAFIKTLEEVDATQASQISGLTTRMEGAESSITTLNNTTATQASSLNSLTTRVGSAESSISTLNTTTGNHASRLTSIESVNTTQGTNISSLQTTTASHATSISRLGAFNTTANKYAFIVSLEEVDATQASQISGLTTRMTGAESSITTLNNTTATQATSLNNLTTRVGSAESSISTLNTTTGNHASRLTSIESVNTTQGTNISSLQTTTNSHATSISRLGAFNTTANKYAFIVSLEEVDATQASQISGLTTRMTGAESSITTLNNTTATQASSLNSLTTRVGSAESSISTLNTTTGGHTTSINNLNTRMGSAESSITSLNNTTSNQATSLSNLTTRMGTAESGISSLNTTTSSQATSINNLTTRMGTAESGITTLNNTTASQALEIRKTRFSVGDSASVNHIASLSTGHTGETQAPVNNANVVMNEGRIRLTGTQLMFHSQVFRVDPARRYKVRFVVRQIQDPTNGGSGVYAGVATLDGNFNALTTNPGTHRYCAATGTSITVAQGRRVFEGIITGEGNSNHNQFRPGTVFVRPMFIVNYNAGNGIAEVESIEIRDITEEAAVEDRSRAYIDNETGVLKAQRVLKVDANGVVASMGLSATSGGESRLNFVADQMNFVTTTGGTAAGALAIRNGRLVFRSAIAENIDVENLRAANAVAVNFAAAGSVQLPAGVIKMDNLDNELKRRLVLIDPDAAQTGGSASIIRTLRFMGSNADRGYGTFVSTTILGGNNNTEVNLKFNGSESLSGRSPIADVPWYTAPKVQFRIRRGTTLLTIPAEQITLINNAAGTHGATIAHLGSNLYEVTGKVFSSNEPDTGGQTLWERATFVTFDMTFNIGRFTNESAYSIEIVQTSGGIGTLEVIGSFNIFEPAGSTGGLVVNTSWEAIADKPQTATRWPAFSEVTGTAAAAQIPNLDAGKITTGTLDRNRLPSTLNKSIITKNVHSVGASDYHLELNAPQGDAVGEVSLRFHQGSRWWTQIRATNGNFRFTQGADNNLANLEANLDAGQLNRGIVPTSRLSGTYDISVSGNAATVTNGVYTTGDQTINGAKTFTGIFATSRGALGTSLNNEIVHSSLVNTSSNQDRLITRMLRTAAGTDWTTGSWEIRRQVDVTNMGYIRFGRDGSVNNVTIGHGTNEAFRVADGGNVSWVGTATGNGSGLTNLNANNLTSGTIPDARLSASVVRTTGNQTIGGNKTFTGAVEVPQLKVTPGNGIGLGAANPTSSYNINMDDTFSPNGTRAAIHSVARIEDGVLTAARTHYGFYNLLLNSYVSDDSFALTQHAIRNEIRNSATAGGNGFLNTAIGAYNQVLQQANGEGDLGRIATAHGSYNYVLNNQANGVVTTAHGSYNYLYASAGSMGTAYGTYNYIRGVVTEHAYGIYLRNDSTGHASGRFKWGIYSVGEQRNYLSGVLGIGTTNPSQPLHVIGNAEISSDLRLSRSDASGPIVMSTANSPLRLGTNGVERARINADGTWDFQGQIAIRNASPTIRLQDTDHATAFLHCNSNFFYVLRGGVNATSWTQVGNGWPLQIDLNNNHARFGGQISTNGTVARGDISASTNTATATDCTIHLGYAPADFYGFRLVNQSNAASVAAGNFRIQRGTVSSWVNVFSIDNGGSISLHDNTVRFRGDTDGNHLMRWTSAVDGPEIMGHGGGRLLSSDGTVALRWFRNGNVDINRGVRLAALGSSWINGHRSVDTGGIELTTVGTVSSYHRWMSMRTPSGGWSQGVLGDSLFFTWATAANIDSATNTVNSQILRLNADGLVQIDNLRDFNNVRYMKWSDFSPTMGPPAGLENVITANWLAAGVVQANILASNGLNVTDGGNRVSIHPGANTPILFEKDGETTFSVNIDGTGFFKGSLAKDTVSAEAIQEEAKKAINPKYLGGGERRQIASLGYLTTTNSTSSSSTLPGAFTTLVANDRVFLQARFQMWDSWVEGNGPKPAWQSATFSVQFQRSVNNGVNWVNIGTAQPLSVSVLDTPGRTIPGEPYYPAGMSYSYDQSFSLTDILPSTSSQVSYRVQITRTSPTGTTAIGSGPASGLRLVSFSGERSAFNNNTIETRNTVDRVWTDRESGFTIYTGQRTVTGGQEFNLQFSPTVFAEVYSITLAVDVGTAGGEQWNPQYRNFTTSGVVIRNRHNATVVISYTVMGRVAV